MKNKKFLLGCLAAVMGLTTFALTGCGNSNKDNGGGTTTITPGGSGNGGGSGTGNGGGTSTQPTAPVLKNISNSFTNARANYSTDTVIDLNNSNNTFANVLNRQFSVLSEDILYRLYLTYGEETYGSQSAFGDLNLYNGNFSDGVNLAKVKKDKAITNLTGHNADVGYHTKEHLDCEYCYQVVINGQNTYLNNVSAIKFAEAITGNYLNYDGRDLVDSPNPAKAWIFNDYAQWNTTYRDQFKLALAKIAYGDETTTLSYDDIIAKLSKTGFGDNAAQKIVNYINNNVIGASLVSADMQAYNLLAGEKGDIRNWSEAEKHYYKGYNIVVPAIVNQALNNTFDNTSTNLYPQVSNGVSVVTSVSNLNVEKDYKSIVLMPNNSNVLVTKIKAKFYSQNSQNKTITVKATVKNVAGKIITNKNVGTVVLTASGTECELNFGCTSTIGAYVGSTANLDTVSLLNQNQSTISLGDNYVELTFEAEDGTTFGVELLGMYDKN